MNEKVKQAQETLLRLSSLALEYLVSNFHFSNKEYPKLKQEIGNLTDKLRLTLNDFDKYYESQQDLIKGKDEYIAKLCNDRAELKAHEKELNELKEFARLMCSGADVYENSIHFEYTKVDKEDKDFDLVKKVVSKYESK